MKHTIGTWILTLLMLGTTIVATNCKKDISKKDPAITWTTPSDIFFGTLLSNTQLNATANVAGTFVYTPDIGSKLNIGENQSLKVDFTPLDATSYNSISKTVKINVTVNTVTDVDGNIYYTVTLGTQIWMVENLRTTKYNDGTAIQYNERWEGYDPAGYCWYNNDTANKVAFGALYSWFTVNTGKLAPTGWHVPRDAEWTTLENYLIANGYNYDGTTTDNKIAKALSSPTGWHSSTNTGAIGNTDYQSKSNATGFTALPGGCRFPQENNYVSGVFTEIGFSSKWWISDKQHDLYAYFRTLSYDNSSLLMYTNYKTMGFSVRCLKD